MGAACAAGAPQSVDSLQEVYRAAKIKPRLQGVVDTVIFCQGWTHKKRVQCDRSGWTVSLVDVP